MEYGKAGGGGGEGVGWVGLGWVGTKYVHGPRDDGDDVDVDLCGDEKGHRAGAVGRLGWCILMHEVMSDGRLVSQTMPFRLGVRESCTPT